MKLFEKAKSNVYTIAEMSANHGGSLDNALAIVKAAKEAGADCLKIQTYTADTLTIDCDNEYFQIHGGLWDGDNLYHLYQHAYTPWEWQQTIKDECTKLGLDFLSTPFDNTAVDFLESIGIEFYKIASFELVDTPLIKYAASKGKPMVISTGMGSIEEIQEAIDACRSVNNNQIVLLKCCSEYPANYQDMHIANIPDMWLKFKLPVGLSDHSMGDTAAIAAVSLGARVIEKHFCLSRKIKTADSAFSMEPAEWKSMVENLNKTIDIVGSVSYELTDNERASIKFRRSLFAVADIHKGEKFTEKNVGIIRPSYGMEPKYYNDLLGKTADCDIHKGEPILEDFVER